MKKHILLIFICTILSSTLVAQVTDSIFRKNILKINLLALKAKNLSLQYERPIASRFSLSLGYRYMGSTSLPLQDEFQNYLDNAESKKQMQNLQIGGSVYTPELRFYFSKKGFPTGFYGAPFVRYGTYDIKLPYQFGTETINMSGNFRTYTGGVMFGAQFKIYKFIYTDIWVIGGHYGRAKGEIEGSRPLDVQQQNALRASFDQLKIPFSQNTSYSITSEGAVLDLDGPWAGLRTGLCLAARF